MCVWGGGGGAGGEGGGREGGGDIETKKKQNKTILSLSVAVLSIERSTTVIN